MSPQKWIEATGSIGFVSKSGRYGGTFAHKDIAFKFAAWISVEFELYLVREFQRLKEVAGFSQKEGRKRNKKIMRSVSRSLRQQEEVPDGAAYKRYWETWDINDYNFRYYSDAQVRSLILGWPKAVLQKYQQSNRKWLKQEIHKWRGK
jgi:hypothetical protein